MRPLNITLLECNGPDELSIEVDLPEGCWPYRGNASIKMHTAKGSGEEYIKRHLPNVPYTVVKIGGLI